MKAMFRHWKEMNYEQDQMLPLRLGMDTANLSPESVSVLRIDAVGYATNRERAGRETETGIEIING